MISDIFLACVSIAAFVIGGLPFYPLARKTNPEFAHRLVPVMGFAAYTLFAVTTYRFGLPLGECLPWFAASAAAAAVLAWLIDQRRVRRLGRETFPAPARNRERIGADVLFFGFTLATTLAPKLVGSQAFAAFQGNIHDQFSYLSAASTYITDSYSALTAHEFEPTRNSFVAFAASNLLSRPAAPIVFGSLARLFHDSVVYSGYVFLAVLQAMSFLGTAWLCRLLGLRPRYAALAAYATVVGFHYQYIVDINAWSHLAAAPLFMTLIAHFASQFGQIDDDRRPILRPADVVIGGLLAGAMLNLYPEIFGVLTVVLASGFAVLLLTRWHNAVRGGVYLGSIAILAVLAAIPWWNSTVAFAMQQAAIARGMRNDWYLYFQAYLFGRHENVIHTLAAEGLPVLLSSFEQTTTLLSGFAAGSLGLVWWLPPPGVGRTWATVWSVLVLIVLAAGLGLIGLFLGWGLARRQFTIPCTMIMASAASGLTVIPLSLVATGQYWAAGKAYSVAWPLAFVALAAPLGVACSRAALARVFAWVLLVAQIAFGLYRPVVAASRPAGDQYVSLPYPNGHALLRQRLDWDIGRWRQDLDRCRGIAIDILDPFMDRYAQIYLTDVGLRWYSRRVLNYYFGIGYDLGRQQPLAVANCLVTDDPVRALASADSVILLTRDRPLIAFARGALDRLEVVGSTGTLGTWEGLYAMEGTREASWFWTNGDGVGQIPSPAQEPVSWIEMDLLGIQPPGGTDLSIEVNGDAAFSGRLPAGGMARRFAVTQRQSTDALTVRLRSSSFLEPNGARTLGVAIRRVTVGR